MTSKGNKNHRSSNKGVTVQFFVLFILKSDCHLGENYYFSMILLLNECFYIYISSILMFSSAKPMESVTFHKNWRRNLFFLVFWEWCRNALYDKFLFFSDLILIWISWLIKLWYFNSFYRKKSIETIAIWKNVCDSELCSVSYITTWILLRENFFISVIWLLIEQTCCKSTNSIIY